MVILHRGDTNHLINYSWSALKLGRENDARNGRSKLCFIRYSNHNVDVTSFCEVRIESTTSDHKATISTSTIQILWRGASLLEMRGWWSQLQPQFDSQ